MPKLVRGNNETVELSEELYVVIKNAELHDHLYPVGTAVRLISGVDGKKAIGYHFHADYVTVCRADATEAEFLGFKKTSIVPLKHLPIPAGKKTTKP